MQEDRVQRVVEEEKEMGERELRHKSPARRVILNWVGKDKQP
jgi:hypothetical protein